jgi:hypothetical protein
MMSNPALCLRLVNQFNILDYLFCHSSYMGNRQQASQVGDRDVGVLGLAGRDVLSLEYTDQHSR